MNIAKHISIFLFFITASLLSLGQTNDSINTKLKTYKDFFSKGLINESEYIKLKQGLLFPNESNITPPKEEKKVDNEITDPGYRSKILGGGILMPIGLVGIVGGIYLKNHPNIDYDKFVKSNGTIDQNGLDIAIRQYKAKYATVLSLGCVISVVGIIELAIGIHDKTIYYNKTKDIALKLSDQNLGLAINF